MLCKLDKDLLQGGSGDFEVNNDFVLVFHGAEAVKDSVKAANLLEHIVHVRDLVVCASRLRPSDHVHIMVFVGAFFSTKWHSLLHILIYLAFRNRVHHLY